MLTIIFGAGASYDSDPDHSSVGAKSEFQSPQWPRPPLSKDLFNPQYGEIAQNHIDALALFAPLRRAARRDPPDVEGELEKIKAQAKEYETVHRQLLSVRYYLRDVIAIAQHRWNNNIHGISTYYEFVDVINRWQQKTKEKVAFITFNYDTLLDTACMNVLHMNFSTISSYVENSTQFQLFKVHGSTNWHQKVVIPSILGDIMTYANSLKWTHEFIVEGEKQDVLGVKYVPAIAIPTNTKNSFECPDAHLEKLKDVLKNTTDLLVIGWRANEDHFLKLWRESGTVPRSNVRIKIVGVGRQSVIDVYLKLRGGIDFGNIEYFTEGFTRFVSEGLQDFLE